MKRSTAAALEGGAFGLGLVIVAAMFAFGAGVSIPWWVYVGGFVFMWPAFSVGALARRAADK